MERTLFTLLFIIIILAMILAYVIIDFNACFEIKGIDHNGNNDPFTIYAGGC